MENTDTKDPQKTRWLTVRKDHVRMPNGVEMDDFFILEYLNWINVIAITEDGKFVMERQYRHGLQKTGIELCAGMIEKGEDPLEAAKRELYEETGYGEGEWEQYYMSAPNPAAMTNRNYTFLAREVKKISPQHLEHTEDIEVLEINKPELKLHMLDGSISQGIMLAPL